MAERFVDFSLSYDDRDFPDLENTILSIIRATIEENLVGLKAFEWDEESEPKDWAESADDFNYWVVFYDNEDEDL